MGDLEELKDLPRSERVLKIFDHPEWGEDPFIPDYQKELIDYSSNQECCIELNYSLIIPDTV